VVYYGKIKNYLQDLVNNNGEKIWKQCSNSISIKRKKLKK
jgi:hypothetical protein